MSNGPQIEVCPPGELKPALELVLRTLPADQRAPLVDSLARLQDEPLGAFEALVVARQTGELHAAAWGQPQPGGCCSLWTPQAVRGEAPGLLATEMIAGVVAAADSAGVAVTQTLAERAEGSMHGPLTQCGFRRIAELRYLQWQPDSRPATPDNPAISFQPAAPQRQRALERIVAATYRGTLDFPELDGMRDLADVLNGYKCVGDYQPDLWEVITLDGQEVGVLLLAEYPETRQLELVYMGVAPEARGKGIGAAAVGRAQEIAVQRGMDRMVLAVDARNHPAQAIYSSAGFRKWAHRFAYLRQRASSPAR